jgi:hypothetical protein
MAYLLSHSYATEFAGISQNLLIAKFNQYLLAAQEDLRDILQREFYEQIESQYPAFSGASDNQTLYNDYIRNFLAWRVRLESIAFGDVDNTPTGEREFNDENSSLLTDVKKFSLEKNIRNKVTLYRNRIINYIKEQQSNDSTKFPLWEDSCKEEMSFAITAIDKRSDATFKINKAVTNNE